jgi:hypothetical protein
VFRERKGVVGESGRGRRTAFPRSRPTGRLASPRPRFYPPLPPADYTPGNPLKIRLSVSEDEALRTTYRLVPLPAAAFSAAWEEEDTVPAAAADSDTVKHCPSPSSPGAFR